MSRGEETMRLRTAQLLCIGTGITVNPALGLIFPPYYNFLNEPAVGQPFSSIRGHSGTNL